MSTDSRTFCDLCEREVEIWTFVNLNRYLGSPKPPPALVTLDICDECLDKINIDIGMRRKERAT